MKPWVRIADEIGNVMVVAVWIFVLLFAAGL